MEEARAVLDRLARIEALDRRATPPAILLGEVRALLAEAEAWLDAEPVEPVRARAAIEQTQSALEAPDPAPRRQPVRQTNQPQPLRF
ncbi:MAG: hypothetical protein ABR521_10305 [Gaiellaceae bacterium]